jgi:hypothetical protein
VVVAVLVMSVFDGVAAIAGDANAIENTIENRIEGACEKHCVIFFWTRMMRRKRPPALAAHQRKLAPTAPDSVQRT